MESSSLSVRRPEFRPSKLNILRERRFGVMVNLIHLKRITVEWEGVMAPSMSPQSTQSR